MSQKALSQKGMSQKSMSERTMSQDETMSQVSQTTTISKSKSKHKHEANKSKSRHRQEANKSKSKHNQEANKSGQNDKPCCTAVAFCDPSPEALKHAEHKAQIRAGIPDNPAFKPWIRTHKALVKAIEEAKPYTDSKQPIVPRDNYCLIKRYNLQGDAFMKLEKDNTILARRIGTILVNGSLVDDRHDPNVPSVKRLDQRHRHEHEKKAMELLQENMRVYESLVTVEPVISRKKHLEWYGKMEKFMEQRSLYPLHFKTPACPPKYQKMMSKSADNPKSYAFLQVEMEDTEVCNIVCELFSKLCPFTAKNFQTLCRYIRGKCDCRSYRCKTIDKLVSFARPDGEYERAYWQACGSVEAMPEFAEQMKKEGSNVKHTKEGYMSKPRGVASGGFYITMGPAPWLDDLCYVFGKIDGAGIGFLKTMMKKNIDTQGNPKTPIHITDCGVIGGPENVPPPMLMRDFILRVKDDVYPLVEDNDDEQDDGKD